ncbi:MAG TPA: hydantoinase/oxoprolinase family protein [Acidimicrobiia bacterium]|nr:hydantoinase/oxoprolinase family protein [Acidimicrobiia bacterium]
MAGVIGVDVGGTFTDIVVFDGGRLTGRKTPTTLDQSVGVAEAVAGEAVEMFLHGTTAATNTLLEERGADVGLLTNPGYEDLIEIGRQDRPSLYDSSVDRPRPLVPRHLRSSDPKALGDAEIVAIALLDSYDDDSHERALAAEMSLPTVLSSLVSPEFREYERLATTVLSAYLTPSVASYLKALDERLGIATRLVMTSSGGLVPFAETADVAGRLVLSGPAGGAVAAAALGAFRGHRSVISIDMGGTSTDVCRISDGALAVGTGHDVAGRVNRVPSVPIRTIGAGGGSISWVDGGGALRVGPRSAGANPGPAVYGKGGQDLTVTDCNVLAGHIPADLMLGGSVRLDVAAAATAADRLAGATGLDVDRVVSGVLEVVDAHMERALRAVSVEEGSDPRDSVLVAFGGAGGLHASRLARRLGIRRVLVPPLSGVFSALGLLLATPRADSARTVMLAGGDTRLGAVLQDVSHSAAQRFESMFGESPQQMSCTADMRYVGQSHELEVAATPDWEGLTAEFHAAHLERFGFQRREAHVEVVNLRGVASGEPPMSWADLPPIHDGAGAMGDQGIWLRGTLPAGFEIQGPGVVVEDDSATLLLDGDLLVVHSDGTLDITIEEL